MPRDRQGDVMDVLNAAENPFGGMVIDAGDLPAQPEAFGLRLRHSLHLWAGQGYKVVWLEVPIAQSALIPVAVAERFTFHHSGSDYLMLTLSLVNEAFIPPYATHYIGAGGVVLNDRRELLVVWEKGEWWRLLQCIRHRRNA